MTGFVKIGGIYVPDSSKPDETFVCHLCPHRFRTPDMLAKHINLQHLRREEAETKAHSLEQRIPEFFESDKELEQYMRSERGKAEWRRKVDPSI